jgi:hypothetical protein
LRAGRHFLNLLFLRRHDGMETTVVTQSNDKKERI